MRPTASTAPVGGDSGNRCNGTEFYNYFSTPSITYSDVQGGYGGTGNVDADPLFTNAAAGDYTLQAGSPVIDAGDNSLVPTGVTATVDMGAFERQ